MGALCRIALCLLSIGCGRVGFEPEELDELGPDTTEEGPPVGGRVAYTATIAECIDPQVPTGTACASVNGPDQLVVDGNDGTTDRPWESYVRFDLDRAFEGRTVKAVKLVMTATDDDKADGPDSGDVWQVTPFDRTTIASTTPSRLGDVPLAASRGSVDRHDVVEWLLPIESVTAGTPVFLGVITDDETGGVNYWNLAGVAPPKLVIELALP